MDTKIKIGDIVEVVDDGEMYTTYTDAAEAMGLKNWRNEHSRSTKNRYVNEYIVVGTFPNPYPSFNKNIHILGITNGIEDFVIGPDGVKLISETKENPLISEEAEVPQLFDINNLYPYAD